MIRIIGAVFLGLASLFLPSSAGAAATVPEGWDAISVVQEAKTGGGKRAILIANSAYTFVTPLPGPPHDVDAMASQLSQLGFVTTILRDPTSAELLQAIANANLKGARGSLLAFYYSGHAAEVDGENSLLLTGYNPAQGAGDQVVPLQTILTLLSAAAFDKVFVAFDACRTLVTTNPVKPRQQIAAGAPIAQGVRGLARAESDFRPLSRKEYAVLFSTSHGETALDSTTDGISPFTKAMISALGRETSFVPAMLLTKRLTEEITKGAQSPDVQIKWNSDITYAKSSAVTNSAFYALSEPMPAKTFKKPSDLLPLTTVLNGLDTQTVLNLKDETFPGCQDKLMAPFFWYSDTLNIAYCQLKQLGYEPADGSGAFLQDVNAGVYNSQSYQEATWKFDLDFDGTPETFKASGRNSGMALTVTSETSEHDFLGLVGPDIRFIGLYDFNKDGILDVVIVFSIPKLDNASELLILDGRKLAKELKSITTCEGNEPPSPTVCGRLKTLRATMKGSSFAYDLAEGYYGADLLQATLYADWNIKTWSIDETGTLELTTYSPTWPYEGKQSDNGTVDKTVKFDPPSGRLIVTHSGAIEGTRAIVPLEVAIATASDLDRPVAEAGSAVPTWCPKARTPVERLVCATPRLAAADVRMSALLADTLKRTRSTEEVRRRARAWLSSRNACGKQGSDARQIDCLDRSYDQWIADLRGMP